MDLALVFSDSRNLPNAPWFALGTLATAIAWSMHGWDPWNMAVFRLQGGGPQKPPDYSAIQQVTSDFFRSPRCRLLQGAWIGVGSLLPWVVYGVIQVTTRRPLRPALHPVPWWTMIIFGVGEGVRGRAAALYFLAGKLKKNWPALLQKAANISA